MILLSTFKVKLDVYEIQEQKQVLKESNYRDNLNQDDVPMRQNH